MSLDSVWANLPNEIQENLAPFAVQFLEEMASAHNETETSSRTLSFQFESGRFDLLPTSDRSIISTKTNIPSAITFGDLRQLVDDEFIVGHITLRALMSFPDVRAIVFFSQKKGEVMNQAIKVFSKTRNLRVVAYGDAELSWSGAQRFIEA